MYQYGDLFKKLTKEITLKELTLMIPDTFFQNSVLFLLMYWCVVPIIVIINTTITGENFGLIEGFVVYQIGSIGTFIFIFFAIKNIKINNKVDLINFIKVNIQHFLLMGMLIWSFFSAIHASDYTIAFFGETLRGEGFFRYLSYAGFYISALILDNDRYRKILLNVFSSISSILSLLTIIKFYGYSIKAFTFDRGFSSNFKNSNYFAYYLTIAIIVIAGLYIKENKKTYKIIYLIYFILNCTCLIINNTFGSYIAIFATLIFIIFAFSICEGKLIKKSFIPFIIFIFISLGMDLFYGFTSKNINQLEIDTVKIITNDPKRDLAGSNRWRLWKNAIKFIGEEPLLGYGPDNLREQYLKLGIDKDRPHNEYIQFASSLGIPALIFYISALSVIYSKNLKQRKSIKGTTIICICASVAYIISALFGNTMYYTSPYFFMILGMCSKIK